MPGPMAAWAKSTGAMLPCWRWRSASGNSALRAVRKSRRVAAVEVSARGLQTRIMLDASTSFWCEIGPFGGRIKCHPDPPAGGPGTMIVDRYAPVNLFEIVPQRAMAFEPELRELDRLLEDDGLFERVKADFSRR